MEKSFKVTTDNGDWICRKVTKSVNGEDMLKWWVEVVLKNEVKCEFICPENWAATRVFQFIQSINNSFI